MLGLSSNKATLSEEEKRRKLLAEMLGRPTETMIDGADIGVKRLIPTPAASDVVPPPAPGNMMPQSHRQANTGEGLGTVESTLPPDPTGSRLAKQNAEFEQAMPAKREKSFWRRLGSGALKGVKTWAENGAQGGLGGLIGATATGGIASGISSKTHAEWGKQRKVSQLWNKYGKEMAIEGAEQNRQQEGLKTQQEALKTQITIDEAAQKQMTAQQKKYLDVWDHADVEFDPENNPRDRAFADEAAKSGVILLPKRKGQRFSAQIAPDGRVVVTNTTTGDYKIGEESVAKPAAITEKDVQDEEFGLYDDKRIETMAAAKVSQGMPSTAYKPEVVAALPAEARNPDGSFNMEEFNKLKDALDPRVADISLEHIMGSVPDNYKQRHAKEAESLRKSQGGLRKQVTRFKSILNHRNPSAKGDPISLDEAKQWFKTALTKSPKELEEFFRLLQQAKIQ